MRLRSLLFVPGDRPDQMRKALGSGADALILDLEDSVAISRKPEARAAIASFLADAARGHVEPARAPAEAARKPPAVFVRINPADGPFHADDLALLAATAPDGIVLPKAEDAAGIRALAGRLGRHLPILPIATETPAAIFGLHSYREVASHLAGLTWGAEDLPAAIGAATSREPDGRFTPPYELARSLTLFAAHAAGVPAIETVYPAFRDAEGLTAYASRARRDGFGGMMAIHPAQVPLINLAFSPSAEEVAHARAVVSAFEASPDAGVLTLEGRMVDLPHLLQARRILGVDAG